MEVNPYNKLSPALRFSLFAYHAYGHYRLSFLQVCGNVGIDISNVEISGKTFHVTESDHLKVQKLTNYLDKLPYATQLNPHTYKIWYGNRTFDHYTILLEKGGPDVHLPQENVPPDPAFKLAV